MSLRAILLIGGLGTRLRPLTLHTPKPLLPVLNRPFVTYQIEWLARHGIRDIVLCTSYRPETFRKALGNGRSLGVRLAYVHETRPLGTGGAIKNAQAQVRGTTLVLNGDVLSALDLADFLRFHRRRSAEASLSLVPVADPTLYGLVEVDGDGRVRRFLEKPSPEEVTAPTINAGAYLLEPSIFERIPPGRPCSVERETFPQLLKNGCRFYGHLSRGYWLDIGNPESYLQAHRDGLERRAPFSPPGKRTGGLWREQGARIGKGIELEGRALLGRASRIGDGVRLAGWVSLGPGCQVEPGASLENCVVLAGARIGTGARLTGCVLGQGCVVGPHSTVGPGTLGDGSVVSAYSRVSST